MAKLRTTPLIIIIFTALCLFVTFGMAGAQTIPEEARRQIYKLEYKAEQTLAIPEIIDVLVSFPGYPVKSSGCASMFLFEGGILRPDGKDTVKARTVVRYYPDREYYEVLKVTGPVLKYVTTVNVCDDTANRHAGGCDAVVENEIEVVSRTSAKVSQKVLRGGSGAGVRAGQTLSCTFQKK